MKILIAGGAGFIGSHLSAHLLKDNHEIICVDNFLTGSKKNIENLLDNKLFTFLQHDVTKPLPQNITADAVFHLASPASPNHHSRLSYHALPVETMMVNTLGTLELLKFAEKNRAKFLFASTSEVYGDPLEHPQREEYRGNVSTTGPRSVYDEAKRFGETLTAYYGRDKGVDVHIARIFNTYGPHMLPEDKRMIVSFIIEGLLNKPIPVFGDGTQTRSLCYVDDMVEGLIRLMFYPGTKGQIINLGSSEEHTVLEYAEKVKKLLGSTSEIVLTEKLPTDDPKQRRADITKAKQLLKWEPTVSLDEGLSKLITYLKEFKT
ncbi:GDP-mannose 4,6-dehydratase [Candidatus Roizmanbacteria bacterium]|nr:GDP-mannose 4,6-dehydratase [Candidatus Roizmanbacteria bacterium]